MQKYNAIIMKQSEVTAIIGEEINFDRGFVCNQNDWWGMLEQHINKPIVSIRPSGRESWDEVIILYANGYLKEDKRVLDYETAEEVECVLNDIFIEAENDEYEVFDWYSATCSEKEWNKVKKWMKRTY